MGDFGKFRQRRGQAAFGLLLALGAWAAQAEQPRHGPRFMLGSNIIVSGVGTIDLGITFNYNVLLGFGALDPQDICQNVIDIDFKAYLLEAGLPASAIENAYAPPSSFMFGEINFEKTPPTPSTPSYPTNPVIPAPGDIETYYNAVPADLPVDPVPKPTYRLGLKCTPESNAFVWLAIDGLVDTPPATPAEQPQGDQPFLAEYSVDLFGKNFPQIKLALPALPLAQAAVSPQLPALLIPGHILPLLPACPIERDKLAAAQSNLAQAWAGLTSKINLQRDIVRVAANRANAARAALASLRREQSELEEMDASGSSYERLTDARAQGLRDISDTLTRLRVLEREHFTANAELSKMFAPEFANRQQIKALAAAVSRAIAALENCGKARTPVPPRAETAPPAELDSPEDVPSDLPTVAYEATMTLNGFVTRVYQDGKMARYVPVDNPSVVSIIRSDRGLIWQIFYDMNAYSEIAAPPAVQPYEISAEFLGTEVMDEWPVDKYRIIQAGIDGYMSDGIYWIGPYGITLKSEMSEVRGAESFNFSTRLTDITIGPQDPSLFELNEGLKEMTFPASGSFTQP